MNKIIFQRTFDGQDSWGAFKEIITIDKNGNLDYKKTEGGNREYGEWLEGEGEERALNFLFGDLKLSKSTIEFFKKDCIAHRGLKENETNLDCY